MAQRQGNEGFDSETFKTHDDGYKRGGWVLYLVIEDIVRNEKGRIEMTFFLCKFASIRYTVRYRSWSWSLFISQALILIDFPGFLFRGKKN